MDMVIAGLLHRAAREYEADGIVMAVTEAQLADAGYELSALEGDVERILQNPDDTRWLYHQ